MRRISIGAVSLDPLGRIHVVPLLPPMQTYELVYRAGMSVHWDQQRRCLLVAPTFQGPAIRQFELIVTAVREELGDMLVFDPRTSWFQVPDDLREMLERRLLTLHASHPPLTSTPDAASNGDLLLTASFALASGRTGSDRVFTYKTPAGAIFAVAGGAGGTGGGAAAADAAIEFVRTWAQRDPSLGSSESWARCLYELDELLVKSSHAGQTTLVIACIVNGVVHGSAVGDSVVWLVRPDAVIDLTSGARPKPLLGSSAAVPFVLAPTPLGSATLLCASDGLWKYAPRERIASGVCRTVLPGSVEQLADLVRLRSGALPDDVAVVIARQV